MEQHPHGLTGCSFTLPSAQGAQTLTPLSPSSRNELCWLPCTATRSQSTLHTPATSRAEVTPVPGCCLCQRIKTAAVFPIYLYAISAWPSKHKVCCTLGFTCATLDLNCYSQRRFIVELTCKYSRMHTVLVYF